MSEQGYPIIMGVFGLPKEKREKQIQINENIRLNMVNLFSTEPCPVCGDFMEPDEIILDAWVCRKCEKEWNKEN